MFAGEHDCLRTLNRRQTKSLCGFYRVKLEEGPRGVSTTKQQHGETAQASFKTSHMLVKNITGFTSSGRNRCFKKNKIKKSVSSMVKYAVIYLLFPQ